MAAFDTSDSAGSFQQPAPRRQYEPFGNQVRQAMQPIDLSAMMPQAQQPLPPVQPAPPRPAPPQSTTRQVTNTTSVVNNVGTTSAANYAGGLYVRFGGPAAPPQEPGPPPRLQSFEKLQREQQDRDAARHFDAMTKLNMVR